jgi:hypothetical protein
MNMTGNINVIPTGAGRAVLVESINTRVECATRVKAKAWCLLCLVCKAHYL